MDPFATLGLPRRYELDLRELEARYRELQRALHPDKHVGASASQRRLSAQKAALVNDAYRALKDDLRRAEALLALHQDGGQIPEQREDPEFLMEMLELREQLGEAREAEDAATVQQLSAKVRGLHDQARTRLTSAFAEITDRAEPAQLAQIAGLLSRLKYFRRFLQEVDATAGEGTF